MSTMINVKTLRAELGRIIERVRRGEQFTVLFRSRPVFRIVPPDGDVADLGALEDDPLYGAEAVGRSRDGATAANHDAILYPKRHR
jgi:prevent-host-death family protein